jgi:hypothetical protein
MALVMLLACLLSIQVRVASLPIREARASWVLRLLYLWRVREARQDAEDRALARRLRGFRVNRWKQVVKFGDEGGMTIRPRLYVKLAREHRKTIVAICIIAALYLSLSVIATAPVLLPFSMGAVINSAGTGPWNVGGTWVGGVAPGTLDDAVILAPHTVTLALNQTSGSVHIQESGALGLATFTLTLDDENAAGYAYDNDGTLTAGTGTLKFTYAGITLADWVGMAGNPYDVVLQGTSALVLTCDTACTIDHDLTITSGHFDTGVGNHALTVLNTTMVFGTLDPHGSTCSWGSGTSSAIDIEAGGVLSAGTGPWMAGCL